MPCCTYLNQSEQNQAPLHNATVTEWLEKAVSVTGEKWLVREHPVVRRRWFKKDKIEFLYELLLPTFLPEYQVINFYRDDTDWTINHFVRAELIVAYLIGVVAGHSKS